MANYSEELPGWPHDRIPVGKYGSLLAWPHPRRRMNDFHRAIGNTDVTHRLGPDAEVGGFADTMSNRLVAGLSQPRDQDVPSADLDGAISCRFGDRVSQDIHLEIPRAALWISELFTRGKCLVA